MLFPSKLAPLFTVTAGSWLARQMGKTVMSLFDMRRMRISAGEAERYVKLGIIAPIMDLSTYRSANFPLCDAVVMIENTLTLPASLAAFTAGDERPGVLIAMGRRAAHEATRVPAGEEGRCVTAPDLNPEPDLAPAGGAFPFRRGPGRPRKYQSLEGLQS